MASSRKETDKSIPVCERPTTTTLGTFPISRYMYSTISESYHPYRNIPAGDFLDGCTGELRPSVLALGCGDILSCFYTLWKNFDFSISKAPKRFDGVEFTLNDCSAAVLARNIVLLQLCFQLPKEVSQRKEWLSAMWAILYCHELYSDHQKILDNSLKMLLQFSTSLEQWACRDNPMQHLIRFTSSPCLADIAAAWKMWFDRAVNISSIKDMHAKRDVQLENILNKEDIEFYSYIYTWNAVYICGQISNYALTDFGSWQREIIFRQHEVISYITTGNCFSECVFGLTHSDGEQTSINFTLYDKQNGKYCLNFGTIPISGYYHRIEFSPQNLKTMEINAVPGDVAVSPVSFQSQPFLANSIQQFTMWVQSTHRVLMKDDLSISFLFDNQQALTFCQTLQQPRENKHGSIADEVPKYSVITTSRAIEKFGLPNVVISTIPLLKDNGLLFTRALSYKKFVNTIDKYLNMVFGFNCEMFPVIFGARFINHEGSRFASSTLINPPPPCLANFTEIIMYDRILILEKVIGALALTPTMPWISPGSISRAFLILMVSCTFTLRYKSSCDLFNYTCIETALMILIHFIKLNGIVRSNYAFWEPLCTSLLDSAKTYLNSIQTQMLLHDIHAHLTVTEDDCPICKQIPLEDVILAYSTEIPLDLLQPYYQPHFLAIINTKSPSDEIFEVIDHDGAQFFECFEVAICKNMLKLGFYLPMHFLEKSFCVTIGVTCMEQDGNIFRKIKCFNLSSAGIQNKSLLHEFIKPAYTFLSQRTNSSLGEISSHMCYDFRSDTTVTLSDSALEALSTHTLQTDRISSTELQISCSCMSLKLKYSYPVYLQTVSTVLKHERKVSITCFRQAHNFVEESVCFMANPDHQLSIVPLELSMNIIAAYSRGQFTCVETEGMKSATITPLVKVKKTLQYLFESSRECSHFHLLAHGKETFLGYVLVNNVLFDYQRGTPALDLAFCFLDHHENSEELSKKWEEDVCPTDVPDITNIFVDDSELELLQNTLEYFVRRTNGTLQTADSHSQHHVLCQLKVDHFFTRAVVYLLLSDPDVEIAIPDERYFNTPLHNEKEEKESGISCNCCGKKILKNYMCKQCSRVNYCSDKCRTNNKQVHQMNCTSENASLPRIGLVSNALGSKIICSGVLRVGRLKCTSCKKTSEYLKKCIKCAMVQYCGKECEKNHWPEHKEVCSPGNYE